MFVYLVTLTNGQSVRVVTDGDPTDHPTFYNRVANVDTLGIQGQLLEVVR